MKNKLITIVFILFSSFINSQIHNGSIIYTVKVGSDGLFDSLDKEMKESYVKDKESEMYTLEFDSKQSVFKYDGGMSVEGYNKSPKLYYKAKDSTYCLRPENDQDFGKIIIVENRNTNWNLISETKIIDGYVCYKATSKLVRKIDEIKVVEFPITAWYCPKIPIPFGPLGYGGLPGLILELQERNILFGANKINFNLQKIEPIVMPKEGKRITSEELDQRISEMFKRK